MNGAAPIWAEINIKAIAHNIKEIRRITKPGTELMAIVKANGYGHGIVQVARTALKNGATQLGVARVSEGLLLRQADIDVPILILGYTVTEDFNVLIENRLSQTVFDFKTAEILSLAASRIKKKAYLHLKIDTGMGRLGFIAGNPIVDEVLKIAKLPNTEIEGIYTHFASADHSNKEYTLEQFDKFISLLDLLRKEGIEFRYRHAANSAGIIDLPDTHLDMVRAGIAIYGIYPSEEVACNLVSLIPAMTLKARVAHVKNVAAGTGISYGVTYRTPASTTVATIPAGYADGYTRLLSSRGEILLRGTRVPVVGKICMDQFMVDTGIIQKPEPGEEAVLIGAQGKDYISADEIARKIGTIAYEVLCMISSRVPRHYI